MRLFLRTENFFMPKIPFWVFIVIALLYLTAVNVDTMDAGASQYAEMSREMMKSGDLLHLFDRGVSYLDKPPFLFWVSAASMKVFGINNFGYKFPSILFALWALFATYRLGRLLYNEATGRTAALVLATCQGMFLMTNDVRCDTILMSWVITAIWLIREWQQNGKLSYFLWGSAAIAFGMMTKGPIALMVPAFCFMSDWGLKRQWRNFVRPVYILGAVIIVVLLLPMSIGLYQQFDQHPEALVNGHHGVSGLHFFYWAQGFGRVTGENPWNNGADISFLLVNMLWSFLPWVFLFLPALVHNVLMLVRQKFRLQPGQEWLTTGGFILSYLCLGISAYQLPHYIFVAFPLAAIVTARYVCELVENRKYWRMYNVMLPALVAICAILFVAVFAIISYAFPAPAYMIVVWCVCVVVWLCLVFIKKLQGRIVWLPAICLVMANVFLSGHVYPELLQYEVGTQVGRYIRMAAIPTDDVVTYKVKDPLNALHFYADGIIGGIDTLSNIGHKKYVLTMDMGLADLQKAGYKFDTVRQGQRFKVSELTPDFMNPQTRSKATKPYYLLKLK